MPMHRDERRGHFVFDLSPASHHERELIGCDLGPVLHLTASGAHLTPDEARDLAETLTWWADRKHGSTAPDEDMGDLFDLLGKEAS